ncbi:hypothetical protein K438DRAFT_2048701 [Mycena galopus ATCC 62051]|nr:hypothetical protein K438DRAFT_2048701 [Mycena galopus ATCC 62051]
MDAWFATGPSDSMSRKPARNSPCSPLGFDSPPQIQSPGQLQGLTPIFEHSSVTTTHRNTNSIDSTTVLSLQRKTTLPTRNGSGGSGSLPSPIAEQPRATSCPHNPTSSVGPGGTGRAPSLPSKDTPISPTRRSVESANGVPRFGSTLGFWVESHQQHTGADTVVRVNQSCAQPFAHVHPHVTALDLQWAKLLDVALLRADVAVLERGVGHKMNSRTRGISRTRRGCYMQQQQQQFDSMPRRGAPPRQQPTTISEGDDESEEEEDDDAEKLAEEQYWDMLGRACKGERLELVASQPLWARLSLLVWTGYCQEALEMLQLQQAIETPRNQFHQPLQNPCYQNKTATTCSRCATHIRAALLDRGPIHELELYKLMVMGKLEPAWCSIARVTATMEDWLWFRLAMVDKDNGV